MNYVRQENYIRRETHPEQRQQPRLRRAALVIGAILALGVGVAACGGAPSTPGVATGSATTTATSSSTGGSKQATGLLAYASCMRSHGVPNFPDPADGGGIPKEGVISAFRAVSSSQAGEAQNACQQLLPAGGSLSGQPSQTVTAQDQHYYLNAARCMRSHGITDFPDPIFSGGGVNFPVASSINQNSTQFTQAVHTCQKLIPSGLPKG
jgi:hypothetical protein